MRKTRENIPTPVYSPTHYDVPAPLSESSDSSDEFELMLTEHERAARDVVDELIKTIEDMEILGFLWACLPNEMLPLASIYA